MKAISTVTDTQIIDLIIAHRDEIDRLTRELLMRQDNNEQVVEL